MVFLNIKKTSNLRANTNSNMLNVNILTNINCQMDENIKILKGETSAFILSITHS